MQLKSWTQAALLLTLTTLPACNKDSQTSAPDAVTPAVQAKQAPAVPTQPEPKVADPAGWVVLAPPGMGFRAAMPAAPQSREEQHKTAQGTIDTTVWMAVTPDGAAFSVGVARMPKSFSEVLTPRAEFDDVRTKLLVKVAGKLIAEKNEELFGHPGRSFSLFGQGPKGESLFRVRLLRVGQRTYQLMTIHAKQEDLSAGANAFFQSFALTDK